MKKNNSLLKSMALSTIFKPTGMLITIVYTPLLLAYLGDEQYGAWVTILSVINWVNYFDVGIGNGYRNILTKQLTAGEYKEAKETTSTAYASLMFMVGIVCIFALLFVSLMDVKQFFNTDLNIKPVLMISLIFICINFVFALAKIQLYALQKSEIVGFMIVMANAIALIGIFVLNKTNSSSMIYVALIVGISGFIVNTGTSTIIWHKYQYLIPKFTLASKKHLREICNLGVKFFLVQISALILYTTDNLIITHIYGPSSVTIYSTVYSAFGIVNSLFAAFMAPLWSKYTEASVKNDYDWIQKTILKLDMLIVPIAGVLLLGTVFYEPVARIWLGKDLAYPTGLILCMGLYYIVHIWGSIYATAMNGLGFIDFQLIVAVISAILNIPLAVFFATTCNMNTTGVILSTFVCVLIANIPCTMYVHHILNKRIKRDTGVAI